MISHNTERRAVFLRQLTELLVLYRLNCIFCAFNYFVCSWACMLSEINFIIIIIVVVVVVVFVAVVIMQGRLVCADYGRPLDYELLSRHNVSLNGTVVIIQHNAVDISPLVCLAIKVFYNCNSPVR